MRFRHPTLVPLLAIALAACTSGGASPSTAPMGTAPSVGSGPSAGRATDLEVYAAASLKNALEAAKTAYQSANPGLMITLSTDSSAALETKIEQGAPADVFLSADTSNPGKLVDGGFSAGDVVTFAGNKLTVIVPADNPAGINAPPDIARSGVKVIACADGVPIQKYTVQWLDKVKALPAYGSDFVDRYAANVVSKEDNVSGIVAKVGLGEGDAGVVYVTDARSSDQVRTIDIPDAENVPATYGGVVIRTSASQDAAHAFLAWLAGPEGQSVLSSFGFLPVS